MTFPGLFPPTGLLGAGPQSTAWLYMFWHAGFPPFVIAYAFLKSGPQGGPVVRSVPNPLIPGCAFSLLATTCQTVVPAIHRRYPHTHQTIIDVTSGWGLGL